MKRHAGVLRNYSIVGLTPQNTVLVKIENQPPHDSQEPPSAMLVPWLTRHEKAILRRGLTANNRDRKQPRA